MSGIVIEPGPDAGSGGEGEEEYLDLNFCHTDEDPPESEYHGSTAFSGFTELSMAREGGPAPSAMPLNPFIMMDEDPAADTSYEEEGGDSGSQLIEDQLADEPVQGRSSVCWDFTKRTIDPGQNFPIEDAIRPWVDQLFTQHPFGMRLIVLPNASRPNHYSTPYGFGAVMDPSVPVHPLLFDRHFGTGTLAAFIEPPKGGPLDMFASQESKEKALAVFKRVVAEHGLIGEETSLSLCRATAVKHGVAHPVYAVVLTAHDEEVAKDFTAYVEKCFSDSVPAQKAFLLNEGFRTIEQMSEKAEARRRSVLKSVLDALGVSARAGPDGYSSTPYHGFSYMARKQLAIYISYGVFCTEKRSVFRALAPAAGFVELRGGDTGWSGVPEAMNGFPTTMHREHTTQDTTGVDPQYANNLFVTGKGAEFEPLAPTGARFSDRTTHEREVESLLGRKYSHNEIHWAPVVLVVPGVQSVEDALDVSVLSDMLFV